MSDQTIETIEVTMDYAKSKLELSRKLDTLINNKEFEEIITKGYFENEAIRIAQLTGEPSMQTPENEKDLMSRMKAIGYLRQYFLFIRREGEMAKRAIEDCQREMDYINEEANASAH